ncbi:histone methyltransferase set2 [Entophlyctis luteolus]|nr:histone methyltransferase set2 [Entophlyctis luteolus]
MPPLLPLPLASADELRAVYTHIERNEHKGGADARMFGMEAMPCMCKWDPGVCSLRYAAPLLAPSPDSPLAGDDLEMACGDSSDCINRFWNKQYAPITVVKTDLKGFGLMATQNIKKGQFVIEYVGEVIPQSMFLKRVREYSEQGVKHFYFMSIKSEEVIDAYKKGNHARFMNHSCAPNCELQKWVVNTQVRMGFFAISDIAEGEELTFDYKFERYGAEPQICYCGQPSCKGIIGGQQKTVISINGDDDGEEIDEEEEKVVGKPRRKSGSDDEDDYGSKRYEERGLQSVETVKAFVKLMLYSTTKPVKLIRLLQKLEAGDSKPSHAKKVPTIPWIACAENTLRILKNLPAVSRNSIIDSKIEDIVKKMIDTGSGGYAAAQLGQELLEIWAQFQTVYRIPKKPSTPPDPAQDNGLKRNSPSSGDASTPTVNLVPSNSVFSAAEVASKRSKFDQLSRTGSGSSEDIVGARGLLSRNGSSNVFDPHAFNRREESAGNYGPGKVVIESVLDTLPKGWKYAKNEEGRMYYYNSELKLSRWDFPRDLISVNGGNGVSPADGSSASAAVVPEVKVKSSIIEGLSEAEYEEIVKRANEAAGGGGASPEEGGTAASKILRALVSEIVVKTLSKHRAELGNDGFKKLARKASHSVLDKEKEKKLQIDILHGVVTDESKVRIKKYVHVSFLSENL